MKTQTRFQQPKAYGICPLCERVFPRTDLRAYHRLQPQVRRQVLQAIRDEHPGWSAEDGVCRECCQSVRDLARVRSFIKKFKTPRRRQPSGQRKANKP